MTMAGVPSDFGGKAQLICVVQRPAQIADGLKVKRAQFTHL